MAAQVKMKKTESDKNWEEFRTKLIYLKEAVDPRYLIESLGFNVLKETAKEVRAACIIHGGDNVTSFRFNKDKKTWVCFSRKCHDIYGNDIIGLIKATQNLEFMDAVDYLAKLVGDVGTTKMLEYQKEKERREFMEHTKKGLEVHEDVDEERLARHMFLRSDLFPSEGFSERTLNYFEIAGGYKTKHDGLVRDIIPIRDIKGKLAAYSLRDIRKDAEYESKYWITPPFNKDKVLYNLYRIVPVNSPIIVVEGFKSVWRLYDYGIKNVVSCMGSELSQGQRNLLCSHATYGIVLLFDNDAAGITGTVNAYKNLNDKMDVYTVFITEVDKNGKGLDPADLNKEQVYGYLNSYI